MKDIQKQVSDLIEEKRVIDFIAKFRSNFEEFISRFIK